MSYLSLLLTIFFFLLSPLHADDFERLTPKLTKEMKQSQTHAQPCVNPAVAEEKFYDRFRYGCFCGKGYPKIVHPSKKHYTKLNQEEMEELITQYFSIKPYDSIDEACMKHDICYIYRGGEDEKCNDAIYTTLKELKNTFSKVENSKKEKRCRALASDISSYFQTIFGIGDNATMFRFGVRAMTTPMTMASKVVQKTVQSVNSDGIYPLAGETCWISDINNSQKTRRDNAQ